MQLLLSRINADRHRNVLELLHVSAGLVPHAPRGGSHGTSSVRLLRHDYRVITALLRKNKAQHRVGRWWQRLEGVRRGLRNVLGETETTRTRASDDGETVDDRAHPPIHVDSSSSPSSSSALGFLHVLERASQPVTTHQERRVPSERACRALATVLHALLRQLDTLLERAFAAAQACSAQLAHTFFMPLSLSGLSLAGRVYAIGVQLLREGVALYNLVRGELMDMLPAGGRAQADGEGGVTAVAIPPAELRCRMKEGALVRLEVISERSHVGLLPPPPPVPAGLQVLGADVGAARVAEGLLVEEDHGQVVSRDEVYAALGLGASTGAIDIAPIFEESAVCIEEDCGTAGSERDGSDTKRPRAEEPKNVRKAVEVAMVEPQRGMASTTATATTATIATATAAATRTWKPDTGHSPPEEPAHPNVQFIRVGSTNPPPVVKPLITRLEEERKRKRKKKKKAVQGDDQGTKKSPWDDLFENN